MDCLNIADNIIYLRRKKKVTQEELASFLNITKASVSKWENKQSFPDIMLLPKIAAYFDVSIDELLGYVPQLNADEINKAYHEFTRQFAEKSFEEVYEKTKECVKKYYSCYPMLLKIAILWLNHFMLQNDLKSRKKVLEDIVDLCDHIEQDCTDVNITSDVIAVKSVTMLQLGKAEEVIKLLEPYNDPVRFMNNTEGLLIQAYNMAGNYKNEEAFQQMCIYFHLAGLIGNAISYLMYHAADKEKCQETISKVQAVENVFDLKNLDENLYAQFHYQCALYYAAYQENEKAVNELSDFQESVILLLKRNLKKHGDDYFDQIEFYFNDSEKMTQAVRDKKLVLESSIQALDNPAFKNLYKLQQFKKIKEKLEKGRELL